MNILLCLVLLAMPTINEYIKSKGGNVSEGHITAGTDEWTYLIHLMQQNSNIHLIGEIGFNAGHSSVLFMKTLSKATVVSFDIGQWNYVKWGKQYVDTFFPGRHQLVMGDSLQSVPLFRQLHPDIRFDLILIDGGHSYACAKGDIVNMRPLAHAGTLVVMDDVHAPDVLKAWEESINEGIIEELERCQDPKLKNAWALGRYLLF